MAELKEKEEKTPVEEEKSEETVPNSTTQNVTENEKKENSEAAKQVIHRCVYSDMCDGDFRDGNSFCRT